MTKLREAENLIIKAYFSNDSQLTNAYENMVNHFHFIEVSEHTNHLYAIKLLYEQPKNKYSLKKIACLTNMDENALRRRRKKYAECFIFFLALETDKFYDFNGEIAAVDISKFEDL